LKYALGDARLVLEREKPQGFDLLAVDAFSSDSIPVHLITREALEVYSRHLSAHGAVAFHISNRYLDLTGVVRQLADNAGMRALRVVHDPPDTSFLYRSDWVILTRDTRMIEWLERSGKTVEIAPRESTQAKARIWTDSYNNLFEVLK
jgi:spermidine synthase